MLPFLHDRRKRLATLLSSANVVLQRYADHDLDLRRQLLDHLDAAVGQYREIGSPHRENELLTLQACYAVAGEGIHPFQLEPVTSRRRAFERAVAFHVLNVSSERLRADHDEAERQLEAGQEQLRALVLQALALGVIHDEQLPPADQHEAEQLWRAISSHPELALVCRQLALTLHAVDITLLLADLLATPAVAGGRFARPDLRGS